MDEALTISFPSTSPETAGQRGSWQGWAAAENRLLAPSSASAQLRGCDFAEESHRGWDSVGHFDGYRSFYSLGACGSHRKEGRLWVCELAGMAQVRVTLGELLHLTEPVSPSAK